MTTTSFTYDRLRPPLVGALAGMGAGVRIGGGRPVGWFAGGSALGHAVSGTAFARPAPEGQGTAACGAKSKLTGGLGGGEPLFVEGCGCGSACTSPNGGCECGGQCGAASGATHVSANTLDDGSVYCGCYDGTEPIADDMPCGDGSGTVSHGTWIAYAGQCWYEHRCDVDTRCSCYERGGNKYTMLGAGSGCSDGNCGEDPVRCTYNEAARKCECVEDCYQKQHGKCTYSAIRSFTPRDACGEDDKTDPYTLEYVGPKGACSGALLRLAPTAVLAAGLLAPTPDDGLDYPVDVTVGLGFLLYQLVSTQRAADGRKGPSGCDTTFPDCDYLRLRCIDDRRSWPNPIMECTECYRICCASSGLWPSWKCE